MVLRVPTDELRNRTGSSIVQNVGAHQVFTTSITNRYIEKNVLTKTKSGSRTLNISRSCQVTYCVCLITREMKRKNLGCQNTELFGPPEKTWWRDGYQNSYKEHLSWKVTGLHSHSILERWFKNKNLRQSCPHWRCPVATFRYPSDRVRQQFKCSS